VHALAQGDSRHDRQRSDPINAARGEASLGAQGRARDLSARRRSRLLIARLDGIARRHDRWGGLTEAEKAAGVAELQQVAGDRCDLLAEVAGLALGTAEGKGREYQP
jgi:hypothetical protein